MPLAITTKKTPSGYVASNADGRRVRISEYFELPMGESRHAAAAVLLCQKNGWKGELECHQLGQNTYVFTFRNHPMTTVYPIGA